MARIRWMFASWTNFAITLSTLNTHHKMKKSKPQLLNQSLILYLLHISLHMGRVVFRCPVNELPAFFDLFSCQSELAATVRISLVHTPQSTYIKLRGDRPPPGDRCWGLVPPWQKKIVPPLRVKKDWLYPPKISKLSPPWDPLNPHNISWLFPI